MRGFIGKTTKWLVCTMNPWVESDVNLMSGKRKNIHTQRERRNAFKALKRHLFYKFISHCNCRPNINTSHCLTHFSAGRQRSLAFYVCWSSAGLISPLPQIHTSAKQLSRLIAFIVRANMSLSKCHWAVPMEQMSPEWTFFRGCPTVPAALIFVSSSSLLSNIRHSIKGLILYSRR